MASAHPTATDLQNLYKSTGIIADPTAPPYDSLDWLGSVASAIAAMRAATARVFQASMIPATRTYDPPTNRKGILTLGEEAISVSSVTVRGVPMTLGADYFLGPENADIDGAPWQWIEFAAPSDYPVTRATRRSVAVTGVWGYSTDVPDDVFDAEVKYAAYLVAPQVATKISGGLLSLKAGDLEKRFSGGRDAGPLASEAGQWLATFERVSRVWARVAVGL